MNFKPIYFKDTDIVNKETLDMVAAHDKTGVEKCNWKAPTKISKPSK